MKLSIKMPQFSKCNCNVSLFTIDKIPLFRKAILIQSNAQHRYLILSPQKSQLFIVKENIFPLEFLFLILIRSLYIGNHPFDAAQLLLKISTNIYTSFVSFTTLLYIIFVLFFFLLFFQFAKRVTGCTFIQSTETCLSKHEYPPLDKMLWIYTKHECIFLYVICVGMEKIYRKSKIDYVYEEYSKHFHISDLVLARTSQVGNGITQQRAPANETGN